jgi:hypothetical protein
VLDVGAAPDGTVWACGWSSAENRHVIHRYVGLHWARVPGTATCLDASADAVWMTARRDAIVSSTYPGSPASFAIDGRADTRWSSQFSDPQWITGDLGVPSYIKRVTLAWESAYGKDYLIRVSNDAWSWVTVCEMTNGVGGIDTFTMPPGTKRRFVQMFGTQRGKVFGYSLYDFGVECSPQ